MRRVVLAMSGGVDSSVAAWLLKQQGYEVIGLFMRSGVSVQSSCTVSGPEELSTHSERHKKQGCCSVADAADARRVSDRLDISFYALDFQDAFTRIMDYFADEYLAGRTPNPCIMCNNWLKFGRLWEFAQQIGAERIATGHYAQLTSLEDQRRPSLLRGLDRSKDQSYVLFGVNPDLLDRILFPVGGFTKAKIRELAHEVGFRVADKPDSQEICFVPDQDYVGFVRRYCGERDTSGEIVDTSGHVLGHHDGYEQFTIGQRKGLGLAFGTPRFVVAIQPKTKRVIIGPRDELACGTLEADHLNWLVEPPRPQFTCHVQIRYQHTAAAAEVEMLADDRLRVTFEEPQFGVAPGQAAVFYDADRLLGGGWIRSPVENSQSNDD